MTTIEFCKKVLNLINNMKNEKLKGRILNIGDYITEIRSKKIEEFDKSVKKFKNDENYEFRNFLVDRHFFFKAIQEINEELIKNNKEFLIDITTALRNFFDQQALTYLQLKGYYNVEENMLDVKLASRDLQYLELVIKEHTNDKELIPNLKKFETTLPVLYVNAIA